MSESLGIEGKGKGAARCASCGTNQRVVLLSVLTVLLIFVGVLNSVLMKVMYVAFKSDDDGSPNGTGGGGGGAVTELAALVTSAALTTGGGGPSNATPADGSRFSFFVNQGVNFLYIVFGWFTVYPRILFTKEISPNMRRCALHKDYALLACIDAVGTFFLCMGAVCVPYRYCPVLVVCCPRAGRLRPPVVLSSSSSQPPPPPPSSSSRRRCRHRVRVCVRGGGGCPRRNARGSRTAHACMHAAWRCARCRAPAAIAPTLR